MRASSPIIHWGAIVTDKLVYKNDPGNFRVTTIRKECSRPIAESIYEIGLVFNAALRQDAVFVGVLHLAHLGYSIGDGD